MFTSFLSRVHLRATCPPERPPSGAGGRALCVQPCGLRRPSDVTHKACLTTRMQAPDKAGTSRCPTQLHYGNAIDWKVSSDFVLRAAIWHNDFERIGGDGGDVTTRKRIAKPLDRTVNAFLSAWLGATCSCGRAFLRTQVTNLVDTSHQGGVEGGGDGWRREETGEGFDQGTRSFSALGGEGTGRQDGTTVMSRQARIAVIAIIGCKVRCRLVSVLQKLATAMCKFVQAF